MLLFVIFIVTFLLFGTFAGNFLKNRPVDAADLNRTGSYNAVPAKRIVDSRTSLGRTGGILKGNSPVKINVVGDHGVPHIGVSAIAINITSVAPEAKGNITAYSSDFPKPSAANIFFGKGSTVTNFALIPVAKDGTISINANVTTHIVVDVFGWLGFDSTTSDSKMTAVNAATILNTRTSIGGHQKQLGPKKSVDIKVAGLNGVPADAKAVIVNISAIDPTASGYIAAYPTGRPLNMLPSLSTTQLVNSSNYTVVPIGDRGTITLYNSAGLLDVTVSIQGYINNGVASPDNGGIDAVSPQRLLDSRSTLGGRNGKGLASNEVYKLQVAGQGIIPKNVSAITIHLTTVSTAAGYIEARPFGGRQNTDAIPDPSSALNFANNTVVSNTVTVPVGPDGSVALISKSSGLHLIADITGWVIEPRLTVTPPKPTNLALQAGLSPNAQTSREILRNANKYAMTTWWTTDGAKLLNTPLTNLKDQTINTQDPVRRLAMEAFSMAVALSTNTYDPVKTGVTSDVALARTIQIIRYVNDQHVANRVNGWGSDWQGSLWSSYSGRAAWLLWDKLPEVDRQQAARMIAYEANDVAGKSPEYLRDRSGNYLRNATDTGSDSTSWWAMPLQLAGSMMPDHRNVSIWKYSSARLSISAWARPSDTSNSRVVNGKLISSWLGGSNAEKNGIVFNHKRIAPDYMALLYQTMDDIWIKSLAGSPTPVASIALVEPIYSAYTTVSYSSKSFAAPGGTIYTPNSAKIYYPQGIDWGSGQQLAYALVDTQIAAAFPANTSAKSYASLHTKAALDMQKRFVDGRTYANDTELNYIGREEHSAQIGAQLFLINYVSENKLVSFSDESLIPQVR